ncbi:MAG: tyrosine-type recombinase/integrase [Proteobacteria bacterium]|nr:tyrosine-type recombinase/integrase [Pseudomonadota bacterium]
MQRWTDEKVRALKLPVGIKEKRVLVEPGLYIFARCRADDSTSKHWQFRAQVEGKRRWLSLGAFPAVGLGQARAELLKHQTVQEAAKKGEADHPVLEAKRSRDQAKSQLTVGEVFDLWIQDKRLGSNRKGGEPVRQRTIDILTQNFNSDIAPILLELKVNRLTHQQIQACIDRPRKRGAPGAAAHVYRTLRGFINFCLKRQLIEGRDPMIGIDNPRPYRPAPVNAANDQELAVFLRVIRDSEIHPSTRLAIELQLLTGARPTEVRLATWEEFDLERRLWTIPAERVKTNREFKVHLSSALVAILYEAKKYLSTTQQNPVCPGESGGYLSPMAVGRALSRLKARVIKHGGIALRPHDLRRTFRTLLSRLGVSPHIAEMCMNHQEKEMMRRVYDGHIFFSEMRSAWECVGNHIVALNKGGARICSISRQHA